MNILLNNREESFTREPMTITELLQEKQFTFKMMVVKVNGKLIRKEAYSHTLVHAGDKVDVIHLMSGG